MKRLRLALRVFWRALTHGITEMRGGWRCLRCHPVRAKRKPEATSGTD